MLGVVKKVSGSGFIFCGLIACLICKGTYAMQTLGFFGIGDFFYSAVKVGGMVDSCFFFLGVFFRVRTLEKSALEMKFEAQKQRELKELYHSVAVRLQMLSHDLKQPFSLLQAAIMLLGQKITCSESLRIIQKVESDVKSARGSLDYFLENIVTAGKETCSHRTHCSLADILETSLHQVSVVKPKDTRKLNIILNHHSLVYVDSKAFSRVFSNILLNSLQAMPTGKGSIWIETTETPSRGVEIKIGNSESYVAPEEYEKIFKPSFSGMKKNSSGLGLSICKNIVEQHGGSIRVDSRKDPKQVEFTINLGSQTQKDRIASPVKKVLPFSSIWANPDPILS